MIPDRGGIPLATDGLFFTLFAEQEMTREDVTYSLIWSLQGKGF